MRNITRTITTTFIKTANVTVTNGTVTASPNSDISVLGEITDKKAAKIAQNIYPGCALIDIETSEQLYSISPEMFVKYGTPVLKKDQAAESEEKEED